MASPAGSPSAGTLASAAGSPAEPRLLEKSGTVDFQPWPSVSVSSCSWQRDTDLDVDYNLGQLRPFEAFIEQSLEQIPAGASTHARGSVMDRDNCGRMMSTHNTSH